MNRLLSLCLTFLLFFCPGFLFAKDLPLVAISQIVAHPALDATYQGALDELAARGYENGKNIRIMYEIAQGDISIAGQIARKFAGENPALIIAIATPAAQTVATAARDIPIVFAAVTDPLEAKLVKNYDKPGKNITGVSDEVAFAQHLEMMQEIVPAAKRIGTVYNPGEANSVATLKKMQVYMADKPGLELVSAAATKTSEVLGAARSLVGKADVLYITLDNTVVSALEAVIQVGEQNKLPVFNADTDSVFRGSIAAVGFDYYDVGRLSGEYAARILNGEKPGDIPVGKPGRLRLVINPGAAKKMGVEIPPEVTARAADIVGK